MSAKFVTQMRWRLLACDADEALCTFRHATVYCMLSAASRAGSCSAVPKTCCASCSTYKAAVLLLARRRSKSMRLPGEQWRPEDNNKLEFPNLGLSHAAVTAGKS